MENLRIIKVISIILLLAPQASFAYGLSTHRGLTDETVDFFNIFYQDFAFSEEEKELIKKGGVDEDENTQLRWMRHFYDPVYNKGWVGYTSSKVWAYSSEKQVAFFNRKSQTADFA